VFGFPGSVAFSLQSEKALSKFKTSFLFNFGLQRLRKRYSQALPALLSHIHKHKIIVSILPIKMKTTVTLPCNRDGRMS
jgi:hypothetical protein